MCTPRIRASSRRRRCSRLETLPPERAAERAGNYVTLGHGHREAFWRDFCAALERVGYDDVLSIEHEDRTMDPVEAVSESVALLRRVTAQTVRA